MVVTRHRILEIIYTVLIQRQGHKRDLMSGLLHLRRQNLIGFGSRDSQADQCRRNMHFAKGSGHGVLASDGCQSQLPLRPMRSQKRRERFAPALLGTHPLKIFLECKMNLMIIPAGRHNTADRLHHRVHRAVIRAPARYIRIVTRRHQGGGRRLAHHRKLSRHGLYRRHLVFSAKGHQYRGSADTGIEHLHQSLLACDLQVGHDSRHLLRKSLILILFRKAHHTLRIRTGYLYIRIACRAVGGDEFSGQIDDHLISPVHYQSGRLRHYSHPHRVQIFFRRIAQELLRVLLCHDDSHTLLRLRDRKLGSVQSRILLGNQIQLNIQSVRQLADRYADTACAEIVADLDQAADLGIAKQSLNLTLCRRVTLLYFRSAGMDGLFVMGLGRTCRAAAAVPACRTAQKDDHIARLRIAADHVGTGRRRDNRAKLHMLGHKARMIYFLHIACRQSDLVSVRAVALCRLRRELSLRKLARNRIPNRNCRIGSAGNPHCLIHIGTAGERIPDRAAQTGRRAAERFNLRRMVVRLVFEHQEPFFLLTVHIDRQDNAAGIDLVALLQIRQLALCLEAAHRRQRDIHQTLRLIFSAQRLSCLQIILIGCLDRIQETPVFKLDILQYRTECCMTAVIRPIGIQHPNLRHTGIPMLHFFKIFLSMQEIRLTHSQSHAAHHLFDLRLILFTKSRNDRYIRRYAIMHLQRLRLCQHCLSGIHRIDAILLDRFLFFFAQFSMQHIHLGIIDLGILLCGKNPDALHRGIRPLVILSRQILHSKHKIRRIQLDFFLIDIIHRRLGQNTPHRPLICLLRNILNIIAVQNPNGFQFLQMQIVLQIP